MTGATDCNRTWETELDQHLVAPHPDETCLGDFHRRDHPGRTVPRSSQTHPMISRIAAVSPSPVITKNSPENRQQLGDPEARAPRAPAKCCILLQHTAHRAKFTLQQQMALPCPDTTPPNFNTTTRPEFIFLKQQGPTGQKKQPGFSTRNSIQGQRVCLFR